MGRPWPVFTFIALAACALAAAACSGGGNDKTPSGGDASATAGASSELQGVRDRFNQSTFKGTYRLSGAPGGTDPLANGTMVIFKDGANQFRFDVTTQQDGQDTKVIFIQNSDGSAFCLDNAGDLGAIFGIDTTKGVCFKSDSSDDSNPLSGLSSTFSDVAADGEILEKTTRSIAGKDATCYRVKTTDPDTTNSSCFGEDGALLYSKTEGTDESEIEATEISGAVSTTDFDLPYEERAFPTSTDGSPTP